MEYYSARKKNKILPFTTAWADLEGILLSEISQTQTRQIPCKLTYMWDLKHETNELTKNPKET